MEDKEKDYVRGRDYQDEKRGSRWTFGDRHSRAEKEYEDPEINKEKDVHVKSPRDRSDGNLTENRDTHSKKLKGFISEKFTHGNTNGKSFVSLVFMYFLSVFYSFHALSYSAAAEENQTTRFKPALGANQGLSLQSHSKEDELSGDVDAAKVAAMQAAELGNAVIIYSKSSGICSSSI